MTVEVRDENVDCDDHYGRGPWNLSVNVDLCACTDGDRTELVGNVRGAMLAAFRQDYRAAESLCATAKAIATRSDADEFLLGGVEYCYANIASSQMQNAQACAGYLRAENYLAKAVAAKPSFAQPFLDEAREQIKDLAVNDAACPTTEIAYSSVLPRGGGR
jgi:hypothetical protein